ncbi:MAG: alpha/beta hydrolase [Myxococcales bacterium]|nr:MAG: alpha/beta hydrolase [Myxococcales bacterium]
MSKNAFTSDGARIRYDAEGEGPPLVLVHGLGDDRHIWRLLRSTVSSRFRTIALDLRGHGESTGALDYDPFGLHRDIGAVVDAERLDCPLLVGHSLGGVAVSAYAARRRTLGVINIDQPLELSGLAASVQRLKDDLHELPASEIVLRILSQIGLGALDEAQIQSLRQTRARLEREVLLGIWQPLFASPQELASMVQSAFEHIQAPYLSLHGSEPTQAYASWLSALVPQARLEVWADGGHFPHLTAPGRFASRLESFFSELERDR